ncbi:uncharacterized protein LAESUDRAFT_728248 [Laetiporus sulphureus 93-53]|uniref:Uncharacterized protein n=1 Tax=Laetiporus sulphureus 93-53 TaxID=1314785 RepID=A0A165D9N7_9APHY|nr:uncharacterized protein LAESUDRAFT_728248 [Laetiporus sulphureus 93-53]KZT04391.1 hypothetical protein LAESUDRAFT_728248 [Laetiporus sulphureus 93-53]
MQATAKGIDMPRRFHIDTGSTKYSTRLPRVASNAPPRLRSTHNPTVSHPWAALNCHKAEDIKNVSHLMRGMQSLDRPSDIGDREALPEIIVYREGSPPESR